MLERVKKAIRISHTHLDDEILETIAVAQAEMIRAGVSAEAAHNPMLDLIGSAILTYCKAVYAPDKTMQDAYMESWKYQLDCLRKSEAYRAEEDEDV